MDKTTFVVIVGALPVAVGATLEAAQGGAFTLQTEYQKPGQFEHRWDEYDPTTWRLMYRLTGRKGRYAWTQYAVHAVPVVGSDV